MGWVDNRNKGEGILKVLFQVGVGMAIEGNTCLQIIVCGILDSYWGVIAELSLLSVVGVAWIFMILSQVFLEEGKVEV